MAVHQRVRAGGRWQAWAARCSCRASPRPAWNWTCLTIGAAFVVVVVVGGMGSLPGAFVAALVIAELKAVCIWLGVVEVAGWRWPFPGSRWWWSSLVMAAVLIWRPWA